MHHSTPCHMAQVDNGTSSTSRSLLERVRSDDPQAWERLVALYAPMVFYWCKRCDLTEHDAADIFQEVFQAVALHIADFHKAAPSDTFRGWLRTITRNKVNDYFRRLGREPRGIGGSDAQAMLGEFPDRHPLGDESVSETRAEQGLFQRALAGIRDEFEERTWRAFWRTAVDGLAPRDAAAELSMSPGAVRVAKSRVLQRLREELGDLMP
jgi:RNA polymerase sigma-70 factor, ECF subfamily